MYGMLIYVKIMIKDVTICIHLGFLIIYLCTAHTE